jgi:hypothetical protein
MYFVHPVFYVSQLEPAALNTIPNHIQPPPEYQISEILDSMLDCHRRQCQLLYLI